MHLIKFDIEKSFHEYLRRVGLYHMDRQSVQYREMKKAYFAGIDSIITAMGHITQDTPEAMVVEAFQSINNQIGNYMLSISGQHN